MTITAKGDTYQYEDGGAVKHDAVLTVPLVGGSPLSASNGMPVAAASGGTSVTLTRTADTNAYTANDVMGAATGSTAALSFAVGRPGGGEFMITSLDYEGYASALISGEANYRLHLYNVTPPSAYGDNAAFDLPSGDRASYLGYIDIPTPTDLGSTLYAQVDGINKQVTLASDTIYAYLVTIGAFTPASASVRKITLHGIKV